MFEKWSDKARITLAVIIAVLSLLAGAKYFYDSSQCDGTAVRGLVWVECVEKD